MPVLHSFFLAFCKKFSEFPTKTGKRGFPTVKIRRQNSPSVIKKDRSAHPGTVKAAGNIYHIAHYMILPERLQAEIRILPDFYVVYEIEISSRFPAG